jgi:maltooligosyltrehalose trehalohydrolase
VGLRYVKLEKVAPSKTLGTGLGARYLDGKQCSFLVWAPKAKSVDVHIIAPHESVESLEPTSSGYFYGEVEGVHPGARYKYRINGGPEFPDPASRFQPAGVHGPSEIVSANFEWRDQDWRGLPLADYVVYELHVGTFTTAGTFDSVIEQLDYLKQLGITAIEIMPVAQFPGERNWGYDGVYPFAVQASYGGPAGLKRFVDAAHAKRLAVVLDVVYNHLGPEGNYLDQYGNYFTDRYNTPWGRAINFDGEGSPAVRRFVVENALQWTMQFHIDALRLDAVHTIFDASETHILREIADTIHRQAGDRLIHLIGESDSNDVRVIERAEEGGYGFDAQWSDDFHHSIHALLTKERTGYYADFGKLHHLAKAYEEGFVYSGQFSGYRQRPHGTSSRDIPGDHFVVFTQNHDQVGNRMLGDRLNQLVVREELKLSAGALILSPFVPMLFMGQEYAESAPFLYFVSHSDPVLIKAVQEGRRAEFAAFAWKGEQPDPQSEATFLRSKLNHHLRNQTEHRVIYDFYRELLRLRQTVPAIRNLSKDHCKVTCLDESETIAIRRWHDTSEALSLLHFGHDDTFLELDITAGVWTKTLDSADSKWLGFGSHLPNEIHSMGKVGLRVAGTNVVLFIRSS